MVNRIIVLGFLFSLLSALPVSAADILYIPIDDRPVCLRDSVETLQAAGQDVATPPEKLLAGRSRDGNPDALWDWLFSQAKDAKAVVVSADSLLYGGLVPSRVHHLSEPVLAQRLERFHKLQRDNPSLRVYVFSTVMRTPKMSAGGTDPAYFETDGGAIYRYSALRDKAEEQALTDSERLEMSQAFSTLPESVWLDWLNRRQVNYQMNKGLLSYTREGLFTFFALGRDDNARYSRTRQELRGLLREEPDLPAAQFATFPGADQLGLVLLTRAVNDLTGRRPFIAVVYAPGTGPDTIPTYQGEPVSASIFSHVVAAGGYLIPAPERAELVLAVNTPADGVTHEAEDPANTDSRRGEKRDFVQAVGKLAAVKPVALADIAFGNGADNSLMAEVSEQGLPGKLAAYSGWNTASNTIGFAVSQGLLSGRTKPEDRQRLIGVRLLDDWAYQANVRQEIKREVLLPAGISEVRLGSARTTVEAETTARLRQFAASHFGPFSLPDFAAYHPWDRMFEVEVTLH